jgi:transcriptional regulator with XRE-family HTH domain
MDESHIGARIRHFRGKLFTQQELADAAGVEVSLIRKLEQGIRRTAKIASLQKIAAALDIDVSQLVGQPTTLQEATSGGGGVVAIRRALTPVDDLLDGEFADEQPVSLDDAERTVTYLWGAYWAGRYELLGRMLPDALPQIRGVPRHPRGSLSRPGMRRSTAVRRDAGIGVVATAHSGPLPRVRAGSRCRGRGDRAMRRRPARPALGLRPAHGHRRDRRGPRVESGHGTLPVERGE